MAIIDIEELRDVLQVGEVYPDTWLQECCDTAANVILSYLTFNSSAIKAVELTTNVATFYTIAPHEFVVGSALTVTGCGATFNGSRTVTAKTIYSFEVAITAADVVLTPIKPYGKAVLTSQATLYDATPEVREAAIAVAVDVWMARQGTTGQVGIDFQPAPYKIGRSLMQRVTGILAKHINTGSMVG
jgi:hypothetical protein